MGTSLSKATFWLVGPQSVLKNVIISGGKFTWSWVAIHFIQGGQRRGLEILTKRVVPSAMHDSAQRVDPPKCHPNTRDAILEKIFQWMIESEGREEWLLWLNGAAGAGKSAIAQSIAERCTKEKVAIASFFFSKTDPTRDNAAGLVATLTYQLIQQIPMTADDILEIIEQDPLIFEKSLESQLKELIVDPLARVHHLLGRLFIFMIDGLDECEDKIIQCNLIQAIVNLLHARNVSVIFLIASRAEPDISASFRALENTTPTLLLKFPLDDIQQASDGIRIFLNDKFDELRRNHRTGRQLPVNWPCLPVVERIIAKCSGQFIYASLVVKFVSSSRSNPIKQLEIIDGIRSPSLSNHPFAHLDALYREIFSQIEPDDLQTVLDIIAYALLAVENRVVAINWAINLGPGDLETALSDLAAVITCDGEMIQFLHASLSDFLLDGNRSRKYHISAEEYTTKLTGVVLSLRPIDEGYHSIIQLLRTVVPSAGVRHSLLQYDPQFDHYESYSGGCVSYMLSLLVAVRNLNFDDQAVYHHCLDMNMRYFEQNSRRQRTSRYIHVTQEEKYKLENDSQLYDLLSRLKEAGIIIYGLISEYHPLPSRPDWAVGLKRQPHLNHIKK